VTLLRPTGGGLPARLRLAARARDHAAIARVEFWLDATRLATDRAAPFAQTRALSARRRRGRGTATVTARAFAVDGGSGSEAVNLTRRGRRGRRAAVWRVTTARDPGGTLLHAQGPARRRVVVTLTPCANRSGAVAARMRLRADRDGNARAIVPSPGLCVLRARALEG
jgi:hypothetical protein